MGCALSKAKTRGGAVDSPSHSPDSGRTNPGDKRLLDEYAIGQTLGEGAFGVVSECTHRSTGLEYAVKMVDKVETPVDQIRKEAALLESLDHENIVRVHGVYYERCFICIVMDKYSGGDLVEGLQRQLKERGPMNCDHIVHVSRQMGASVQYLHMKLTVHRDIKGDNYLTDRKDLMDPECKVVLTDFGTATRVAADERLSAAVGTKIFWAPEFFDRNYSLKVDVWAMGVIMYGLVSGRFPFVGEADVRAKELRMSRRIARPCQDFIRKILEKTEAARLSADQAMRHDWFCARSRSRSSSGQAGAGDGRPGVVTSDDDGPTHNMRAGSTNDGIKARRKELIDRLNKEHNILGSQNGFGNQLTLKPPRHHADGDQFVLKDKANNRTVYVWMDRARQRASKIPDTQRKASSKSLLKENGFDVHMVSNILEDHNIDISAFGRGEAKPLSQLAAEVDSGAARLMLDATQHKQLVRVCDIVELILRSGGGERILIETGEELCHGGKRVTNRLPSAKKEPHQSTRQVAERILKEFLQLDPEGVKFDLGRIERVEEEIESQSYPGIRSVHRKELVAGTFSTADAAVLAKVGLPSFSAWHATDAEGNTKLFGWMTSGECDDRQIKLQPEAQKVSTLVRAPIGLGEEALRRRLTNCGVDASKFGADGAKTLKEFSAELVKGESALLEDSSGRVVRIVDVVVVAISRNGGSELLVQTEQISSNGTSKTLNRLPGAKRRPDENHFLSARRIIRRQLEIDDNRVAMDRAVQSVEEEMHSPFYPGLMTVYRKRLVSGGMRTE